MLGNEPDGLSHKSRLKALGGRVPPTDKGILRMRLSLPPTWEWLTLRLSMPCPLMIQMLLI